jgi:hypothetical protein
MPPNFSRYEEFEPLFRQFNDTNAYDIMLALNWFTGFSCPSGEEQREEFSGWIDGFEHDCFLDMGWDLLRKRANFNDLTVPLFDESIIPAVFNKYKENPEYVLKMAIFESGMLHIVPIIVFFSLNSILELADCVNSPILNGFLKSKPSEIEIKSFLEFLKQTVADLGSYNPTLISTTLTDVVKDLFEKILELKLASSSSGIIM